MLLEAGAETFSFRNVLIGGWLPQQNTWRFAPKPPVRTAGLKLWPKKSQVDGDRHLNNEKLTDAAEPDSVQPLVRQIFFD
jgi:hypothetical protein